jgi:hypothetical protein
MHKSRTKKKHCLFKTAVSFVIQGLESALFKICHLFLKQMSFEHMNERGNLIAILFISFQGFHGQPGSQITLDFYCICLLTDSVQDFLTVIQKHKR